MYRVYTRISEIVQFEGGPYIISKVVRKFQFISEIFVPGGPHNYLKYLDRGGGGGGGGGQFIMTGMPIGMLANECKDFELHNYCCRLCKDELESVCKMHA